MRAQIAYLLGLLWLFCLSHAVHAYPAQVTAATPLLLRVNGKVVNGPVIPSGRRIEVLATSPTGGFVQADFAGKRGWLNAKNIRALGGNRQTASYGSSHASAASNNGGTASLNAGMALQGSSFGVGFGAVALFNTPWSTGQWRFEGGPGFYLFPSVGSSTTTVGSTSFSAFEILGDVRGMYSFNPTMEVGGEVGLMYLKINFPNTITGFTTTVDIPNSFIGLLVGGAYSWRFASDWRLLTGLRFLIVDGSTYQLNAGVEYRF